MLFPMLIGALVQGEGWLQLELPEWLLALACRRWLERWSKV
jgi:uncharacterized membrane protein AbrB (regulator of aidB expression)